MADDGKTRRYISKHYTLSEEELEPLKDIVRLKKVGPREHFFREGDVVDYFYRIRKGLVCLYTLLPGGRRVITDFLSVGDIMTEANRDTYSFSALTLTEVEVSLASADKMEELFQRAPAAAKIALDAYIDKVQRTHEHVVTLGRKTPFEKVATFLFFMLQRIYREGISGPTIEIPLGRDEIGDYLCISSETVSRAFSQLLEDKIIKLENPKVITIVDFDKLLEVISLETIIGEFPENAFITSKQGATNP